MNTIRKYTLMLLALGGGIASLAAQEPYKNPNLSHEERARDLLSRMTLQEKISQMMHGSPAIERLGVPPTDWWNEALHGVARAGKATVFPQAIGLAATFDDEAVLETFSMISDEARAKHHRFKSQGEYDIYKGLTFWTPNINIYRDPRWGRGQETYGEDPFLTERMGVAAVRGLQGDTSGKYYKTHACAKHYAVHSGPEWNRHSFDAKNISQRDLWETYLPAFRALVVDADVREVMCAYNRFEGEPCCSSDELLMRILRQEWGFDGVVVSDCGAIDDFFQNGKHMTHPDAASASASAVISGTDLNCGGTYWTLGEAVEKGLISEQQIDASISRLLTARFQLGMFDDDEDVPWAKIPYSVVESPAHVGKALEMARKSIVLLENKNGVLPLRKGGTVAVVGPNAADSVMLWANYNGTPTKSVTILEGIRSKLPAANVIYSKGCDYVESDTFETDYADVVAEVASADVIIFAGGVSPRIEGEEMNVELPGFKGGDRTTIELPEVQRKLLAELKKTGKPVILVLCSGSSMALKWESENLDGILAAWYPGQQGGTAVADVLFGDYNPAGRLPLTFYASTDDLPDFENYDMQGGAGRTYRYFKGRPIYPFGYGLSYTDFAWSKARVSDFGDRAVFSVNVKNTGKRAGDEVVQLYIRNPLDPDGPAKSLRGFARVGIGAGEKKPVEIALPHSAFEFFDTETGRMAVKPGTYQILYGASSDDSALKSISYTLK